MTEKRVTTKKDTLQHHGYIGTVESSVEDECLHGRVMHIDDLVTYEADTVASLKAEFRLAVERYLAHCKAIGKTPNKPYSGTFNVRIGPDLHRGLAQLSATSGGSINELVSRSVAMLLGGSRKANELLVHHRVELVSTSPEVQTLQVSSSAPSEGSWTLSGTSEKTHVRQCH